MKKQTFLILAAISLSFLLTACTKKVVNKEIPLVFNEKEIDVSFTGTLKSNKPTGDGSFTVHSDGGEWSYSGTFEEGNAVFSGVLTDYPLTVEFTDTEYDGLYTGAALNGSPDGEGRFIYSSGQKNIEFDGTWKNSSITGPGKLKDTDFTIHFKDVTRTGSFEGETMDGIATGKGTFSAKTDAGDAYTYTGEWKNNIFDGLGERKWDDDSSSMTSIGTFVNGEFRPTKAEFILSYGTMADFSYRLSSKNKEFIEQNDSLFPALDETLLSSYVVPDLTYEKYSKTPDDFQGQIMDAGLQYVLQIFEENWEAYGLTTITTVLTMNEYGQVYYTMYFGKLDDIFTGDMVYLKGLPISYTTYSNVDGGETWCIAMLGSNIQKQ